MDNSTVVKIFYNRKVVNLTFDLAGGFLGETEGTFILSSKYGASVEVPTDPKRENYTFDGWDKTVPESFPANDETYTAKWRDINQVASVTFSIPAGNVSKNTTITLSCATEGATIYYRTSEKDEFVIYDSNAKLAITEETTITAYAICEGMIASENTSATYKLYQYTLAFETNAGSEIPDSISYSDGVTVNLAFQTTREGYDFAGWYMSADYSGDSVTELTFSQEMEKLDKDSNTVTLYAKWTSVEYTITYELKAAGDTSGPENPNVISYTIETETITLQNPTRNGYDFVGWYTDEDYTSQITQIEKGSTGDITLYAQWIEIKTSINVIFPSYDDQEIIYDEESHTFTAEEEYSLYEWYIDGVLKETQTSNSFKLDTNNMPGGIYTLMLIVTTKSGKEYSAECQVIITKIEEN